MRPAFCEGCEHVQHFPPIRGPEGQYMEDAEDICGYDFDPTDPGCPRNIEYLEEKLEERDDD